MSGRILVAATPIGNISDASPRLWEALEGADVVAAEDTRVTRELAARGGKRIGGDLVALHDHNESSVAGALIDKARGGQTVVLVSDAGTPLVSDPGYRLVAAAIAAGVTVQALPGPSAVLAALSVSGLPTDRFAFEGFLPRKEGERASALAALASEARTLVFFEAPHRLGATIEAMAIAFGPMRRASVSRELTKRFEETVRGPLGELAQWAGGEIRGEIVIVVEGRPLEAPSIATLTAEAVARIEGGERAKDVVAHLASTFAVAQRELYSAVLAARSGRAGS